MLLFNLEKHPSILKYNKVYNLKISLNNIYV